MTSLLRLLPAGTVRLVLVALGGLTIIGVALGSRGGRREDAMPPVLALPGRPAIGSITTPLAGALDRRFNAGTPAALDCRRPVLSGELDCGVTPSDGGSWQELLLVLGGVAGLIVVSTAVITVNSRARSHGGAASPETEPAATAANVEQPLLGVALAGGGAKGAYQIGVWRALREHALQPEMIAGASVGALNGAFWWQGDFDAAVALWSEMSWRTVFRFSFANSVIIWLTAWGAGIALVYAFRSASIAVAIAALLLIPLAVFWFAVNVLQLSYADNGPLRRVITSQLRENRPDESRPRFTVATSSKITYFDPDRPAWKNNPWPQVRDELARRNGYATHYSEAGHYDRDTLGRLLLQSAALPYVFRSRALLGRRMIDGGMADNVPLVPLLAAGCRTIVIVHLNGDAREKGFDLRSRTELEQRLRQLRRIEQLCTSDGMRLFQTAFGDIRKRDYLRLRRQGKLRPLLPLSVDLPDSRLVHIVPSKPLGNFLTGTMNFHPRKCRALMALGYADAHAVLSTSSRLP